MKILKQMLYIFLIKNFQTIKLTFLYEPKELIELGFQINFPKENLSDIVNLIIQKNIYKYISIFTKISINQKYIGTQLSLNTKFNLNISINIYKKINLNLKKIYIDINIGYLNKKYKTLPKLIKLNIYDIIISKNETIQNPNIKIDKSNQLNQMNTTYHQININNNKTKEINEFIDNSIIPKTKTKKQNYKVKKIKNKTTKKKKRKISNEFIPFLRTQQRAIIREINNKETSQQPKEKETSKIKELSTQSKTNNIKSKKTFLKKIKKNPLIIEIPKYIKETQSEKSEETNKITSEKTSISTKLTPKKPKLNNKNTEISSEPSTKSTKKSKINNRPPWRQ